MINDFFSQCFNSSVPPLSLSDIFPHSPTDCPSDLLCTFENIIQLISQLPTHTSTGPDGISSKMLKATTYSISVVPLCKLFNLSLSSDVFPMDWKTSLVIPIPKQSSPNPSPSNYHPLSLLSLDSKLLERHVFDWLHNFCKNNVLFNNQFGFRSSFSTESVLITSTHSWFIYSTLTSLFVLSSLTYVRPLILYPTDLS